MRCCSKGEQSLPPVAWVKSSLGRSTQWWRPVMWHWLAGSLAVLADSFFFRDLVGWFFSPPDKVCLKSTTYPTCKIWQVHYTTILINIDIIKLFFFHSREWDPCICFWQACGLVGVGVCTDFIQCFTEYRTSAEFACCKCRIGFLPV